jgi:hypothetical protein
MVAVGEGHGARVHQEADLHHLAPLPALRQGGHGEDADRGRLLGAAHDEFERLGAVDGGGGVGAGDHGGDPAGGGGEAGGAEAFLVALSGFGDLHADVDDAGGEEEAARSRMETVWDAYGAGSS